MSCGVGCRQGSDPALLWLWYRPAAITDSTLSLGTSISLGCGPKKKKKKATKRSFIEKGLPSPHLRRGRPSRKMTQLVERLKQEVSFWLAQVHFPTYQVSGDLERESRPQPGITSTAEMGSQGVQIQQKPQSEVDTELVQMPEKIQRGQRQGGPPRT